LEPVSAKQFVVDEESHNDISYTLQASRDFRIISRLSKMLEATLELLDDPGREGQSRSYELSRSGLLMV